MRQVAGPYPRLAPAYSEVYRDGYISTFKVLRNLTFIIRFDPLTGAGNGDATDRYREMLLQKSRTGLAHCHDDSAPIGILACDGRLDQWGVGNSERGRACFGAGRCPGHIDGYKLARAFAVADHLNRKIGKQFLECAAEGFEFGRRCRLGSRVRCAAGGCQQGSIAGRGIAVDGNTVKGMCECLLSARFVTPVLATWHR